MPHQIEFEPIGRRGLCPEGFSFLDCARQLGVGLVSICGGHGKCLACKVRVLKGKISEPTSTDRKIFSTQEISEGWRLACLTFPQGDCTLHVPPESMTTLQRTQVECLEVTVSPDPAVKSYTVKLIGPTLHDLRSDTTRLLDALRQQNVDCRKLDIELVRNISQPLRDADWNIQASLHDDEIIAISARPPGGPDTRRLGLAVDVGTTKIASYLVDLDSGQTLASRGLMNPQISYGEDITSRILNAMKSKEGAANLRQLVVSAIDQAAREMCEQVKAKPDDILDAAIVGNTAIHHLMLGLPVKQLALSPFVAAVQESLDIKARDMGLHLAPGAYVYMLPNVAGFVGADHVSMLLAIDAGRIKETTLAIDIGTNTEVSLIYKGQIYGASCASGPAFEGGHIKHGMRAADGAIERVRITNGKISYQTINNAPPVGICGSGVIDALAQFYQSGMIDEKGRVNTSGKYARQSNGQPELVVASEQNSHAAVTLTQHDIRELQLAKAAIRAGIQVLLETAGLQEKDIEQVIIAGAFGTYIDVSSAITMGMLPSLPLERFHQVGNAAGLGAKIALISRPKRQEAEYLGAKLHYVELATAPRFMQTFAQSSYLGLYRIRNGKREVLD
jgi:uncharacterized 2Fe-2S/4Fe-4S cluster protein (DUF4445 family)